MSQGRAAKSMNPGLPRKGLPGHPEYYKHHGTINSTPLVLACISSGLEVNW